MILLTGMLVVRRMDDGRRSYTALLLPGEPPRIFPTSEQEHARILQIYKQDRAYEGVLNDFTDFGLGAASAVSPGNKKPAAIKRRVRRRH